jgi:hypothetical protein
VVPINSSPLTITLFFSVITTLVYNDTKYSAPFHDVTVEFDCTSHAAVLSKIVKCVVRNVLHSHRNQRYSLKLLSSSVNGVMKRI